MTVGHRPLGRSGLEVSELGFGSWGIGRSAWVGGDDAESLRALSEAIALGVDFVDTALGYNDGHSERLVGQAIAAAREPVTVATKVPPQVDRPARPGDRVEEMFSAAWITECTERSLAHLGLETIDLQQLHTWSDEWVGQGDWAEAVADLKRAGKIRAFGVSINNHDPASVLRLVASGLVDSVQVIYNVFDQSPEDELFPAAVEHGVGIIARVPFDEGGLTGTVTRDTTFPEGDFRNVYFAGDRRREVEERVAAITRAVGVEGDAAADTALRFCLSDPAVSTVIAGMRSVTNVRRNVASAQRGALSAAQVRALRPQRWVRDFYTELYPAD